MTQTIKQVVADNIGTLKNMTLKELYTFSVSQKWDNRTAFSNFKKALGEYGIFYNKMREEKKGTKLAEMKEKAKKSITLYADAKASAGKFGICDKDGRPLWFGNFFDSENCNEQSIAELEAAKKAIWLARKAFDEAGEEYGNVELKVDASYLTYANAAFNPKAHAKRGGQARELGELALRYKIYLNVSHVSGDKNPADSYTTGRGFKKWNENNLSELFN